MSTTSESPVRAVPHLTGQSPLSAAATSKPGPNGAFKRPSTTDNTSSTVAKKPTTLATQHATGGANDGQKPSSQVPACLKKLVRSIVRTFYSREHSLIVDMLVRNTIMHEDDLCERLRFEKKQLRQYLHTLKTDQFIKSKLQLETDTEGKTTKITHYFIEYQLFVNVVKYRLDQMQRRLEAEQRQSTSRASFRCASCRMTYTDLEVDRLIDLHEDPGRLACVYCRGEVTEQEEDSLSRTDARALIAKFHQQVRDPIDKMLRECDEIHLSSSILEPEIRPLEPLKDEFDTNPGENPKLDPALSGQKDMMDNSYLPIPTPNSHVRIVLTGRTTCGVAPKQRPAWMADSTINAGPSAGLGELDRGPGLGASSSGLTAAEHSHPSGSDSITQTLTPGRIASGMSNQRDAAGSDAGTPAISDIMQLLLVHERRGPSGPTAAKTLQTPANSNTTQQSEVTNPLGESEPQNLFTVRFADEVIPYTTVTSAMVKRMSLQEKADYIRVGKLVYQGVMLD